MVDDKGIPHFFAFGVALDDTVYDGRLAGLCMEIVYANGVDLDVLWVVDIDELLIDVRAVCSRVIEGRVGVARLISNLGRK